MGIWKENRCVGALFLSISASQMNKQNKTKQQVFVFASVGAVGLTCFGCYLEYICVSPILEEPKSVGELPPSQRYAKTEQK